jgi:hypothetical protein
MTALLREAVAMLRSLPDEEQDTVAERLIQYVNELTSPEM